MTRSADRSASPAVDAASIATGEPPHGYLWRVARVLVFGTIVAGCLTLIFRQNFWVTLVYSLCIALLSWIFIDGGRLLASNWIERRAARGTVLRSASGSRWPGTAWMVGIIVVGTALAAALGTLAGDAITGRALPAHGRPDLQFLLSSLIISLIPAIGITFYFYSRETIATQRRHVETAERQATESQLKLLASQLEPHMLFNTLANLRVLIGTDPARAQSMLDHLIAFLRSTLAASRVGEHTLEAEFARLGDYLALIQVRMGERLQTRFDLPAALAPMPVPALLLQPLVENSVKHGIEPHVAGGRIEETASTTDSQLVLTVRDSVSGRAAADRVGDGFGLTQVRERLATRYGARASLELSAVDDVDGGTLAVVRLPRTP